MARNTNSILDTYTLMKYGSSVISWNGILRLELSIVTFFGRLPPAALVNEMAGAGCGFSGPGP